MSEREQDGAEQQGDGQPENIRELQDASGGDRAPSGGRGARERPESGMGGTSDAGTAGDEATESAAYRRGLPDDATRRTGRPNEPGP